MEPNTSARIWHKANSELLHRNCNWT